MSIKLLELFPVGDSSARFPRALSATWHEPSGDFMHVKGRVVSSSFNVEQW